MTVGMIRSVKERAKTFDEYLPEIYALGEMMMCVPLSFSCALGLSLNVGALVYSLYTIVSIHLETILNNHVHFSNGVEVAK